MGGLKQEKEEYGPFYHGSKSQTSGNGRLEDNMCSAWRCGF